MARRRGRRLPPRGRYGRFVRRGSRRRGSRRGRRGGLNVMKLLPVVGVAAALYYFFVMRKPAAPAGLPIDVASRVISEEERLLSQTQPG